MPTQTLTRPATKSRRIDLDAPQAEALRRLLLRVGVRGTTLTSEPFTSPIAVHPADFSRLSMVLFRLTPRGDADAA